MKLPHATAICAAIWSPIQVGAGPLIYMNWSTSPEGYQETLWIAPYVQRSNQRIGDTRTETVTWFRPDGTVERALVDPERLGPCVVDQSETGWEVFGIDWGGTLHLPYTDFARYPSIRASKNGEHRVVTHRAEADLYWITSFLEDRQTWRRGPYPAVDRKDGLAIEVGDDGSVGFVTGTHGTRRVVLLDPLGEELLRRPISEGWTPIAVAAHRMLLKGSSQHYVFIRPDRDLVEFQGVWGEFVAWLANSNVACFRTRARSLAAAVDCATGKTLWTAPRPTDIGDPHSAAEVDGLLFVHAAIQDSVEVGDPESKHDVIDVYDTSKGTRTGRWTSDPRLWKTDARLQRWGHDLWFVSNEKFAKIDLNEVRNAENGWDRVVEGQ